MLYIYILFSARVVNGLLWKNGVVHYAINSKDYDVNSQDIITTTLSQIQERLCIKFFQTSSGFNATVNDKILYINNPDKRKHCSPILYDFSKNVVDMPIGYKCLNQRDITRIVVDMLRASIDPDGISVNSYDFIKKFDEKNQEKISPLITSWERDYINSHYKSECGLISMQFEPKTQRRNDQFPDSMQLSDANMNFYGDKIWPLAIVLYGVDEALRGSPDIKALKHAMTTIEVSTCVVFQEVLPEDHLLPKSIVWFTEKSEEVMPKFGFVEGNQTLKLSGFMNGAPGHTGHTMNNLLRILGVPMMSNRYDRDNHVIINWRNVEPGKEQYLEKTPETAWIVQIPYDYESVTHAPANYMCRNCELGATTVQPIQDQLWQRTMSMGHTKDLSDSDIQAISMLYGKQCGFRFLPKQ